MGALYVASHHWCLNEAFRLDVGHCCPGADDGQCRLCHRTPRAGIAGSRDGLCRDSRDGFHPYISSYIALLRGINVGKAKRIAMADLRALLEDLGYTDVGTLLNSGNVVFKAGKGVPKKLAADISAAIATHLGIEVPVIVVSAKELALIVRENPFASADDPSRLLVAFVADVGMLSAMSAIEPHVVAPEQFHVGTHAAYLHCASGILESKAAEALLGKARPPPPATGPPC